MGGVTCVSGSVAKIHDRELVSYEKVVTSEMLASLSMYLPPLVSSSVYWQHTHEGDLDGEY